MPRGGRSTANERHWHVWSARSVWAALGLPPLAASALSPSMLLGLQVALQDLSQEGPGLRALPRSRLLRSRFSGSPQRRRLGWAWVLCPSQVRAALATGCLASALSPGGRCVLPPPRPGLGFLGSQREHHLRCTVCLLWGADHWLRPSWRMSAVQDPRKIWLAAGSLLAVW